ncbi:MAG: heavy metal sensor histidine kinase [Gammaproteobacteria bacterium]|nr:heavy metal sensor histidine kinase [Gammaproteobacteria bacterium]
MKNDPKNRFLIPNQLSIQSLLVTGYSIAVTLLLTLTALLLYWLSFDVAKRSNYDFMKDEARNIQSLLSHKKTDFSLLKKYILENPDRSRKSVYSYYVRLFENDKLILETPHMSQLIPADITKNYPVTESNDTGFTWHHQDKKYVVMITKHNHWRIEMLLDTSNQSAITHERIIFSAILLIGLLLAIVTGYFVTRRGLVGLNTLTDTVHTITSGSLNQRINPLALPPELRKLGKAFNQMLARLEEAFARLKHMSDELSHELGTPITSLIMQTESLLASNLSETDYRETLASNLEELQKMASLIENILFLARADNAQVKIQKSHLQADKEIQKILEYYAPLCDEKNISIALSGNAEVTANPIMFSRLMSNLISNAVKYSKQNSRIHIGIQQTDTNVHIQVEDTGIGIATNHLPHIFERFYRAEANRSDPQRGTGLGLAIAQSIVKLHNGSLQIESTKDVGTRVKIIF